MLTPILQQVQKVTQPLQPIIDILTMAIPGVSELAGHDVTLLDSLANRVLELAPNAYYDLGLTYGQYLTDEARLARHGSALTSSAA